MVAHTAAHQGVVAAVIAVPLCPLHRRASLSMNGLWVASSRVSMLGTVSIPDGGRSIVVTSATWRGSAIATPLHVWTRSARVSIAQAAVNVVLAHSRPYIASLRNLGL
jgi:hypothetical protein